MKIFNKVSVLVLASVFVFALAGPLAFAASSPSLGQAASYGILASTYTNTVSGTTVNGDVGFTTGPAVAPGGTHNNYGSGAPYATAGTDQGAALSALALESCTFTFGGGAIDLSTDTTHGTAGIYTPGVYCSSGAMDVGGPLTLSGAGTYIFRPVGALTSTAGAVVTLTGASACDVFWTPTQATTLAANTTFAGTVIDNAGITVGANTTWTGRALAFGGTVTTDTDTITVPTCTTPTGTINVVKTVVNDNGRTLTIADFPLFVNGSSVTSGATNTFAATGGTYSVTETSNANYTQTFSGDCNTSGNITLAEGQNAFCIVTNNDIAAAPQGGGGSSVSVVVPPIIDVLKVPDPLALPDGPGPVEYTYTTRNIGTVPMSDVTMVGDTCSPITLVSGDTNSNDVLEVSETWVYTCTTTLTETHTNTVVATGWANGLSAVDIASATVVVDEPEEVVPPLIHVTKVPDPLTLPVGGGMVTYTETITNPGTVDLSNVTLSDDKCSPLQFNSGDSDNDDELDTTETWTYTCRESLSQTTTNTAVATGEANGITVRDFAIVTVVVPVSTSTPATPEVPGLPDTGFTPLKSALAWSLVAVGIFAVSLLFVLFRKKQSE